MISLPWVNELRGVRVLLSVIGAASLIWPGLAAAIELDYYTYNAFEETVSAFQRLALVFSNNGYLVFALIFAVAGVVIKGAAVGAHGFAGGQIHPFGWLIPTLAGLVVFQGLVIPRGTLHIYDPVRNAYQPVGDVPDIIVLVAGGLNKIERAVIEIIDSASANPYGNDTGAVRYSLLLNALGSRIHDVNLERSMSNYYRDCGIPSMATGFNGVSLQQVKRDTADLYNTFALFNHPSFSTVWYASGNDSGQAGTCAAAWSYIGPILADPATIQMYLESICVKAGFNRSVPQQMTRCNETISEATDLYGLGAGVSSVFLRSTVLAKSISDALNTADFSIEQRRLVDRQIMAEGFGSAEAMNQWVPKLRGYMIAMAAGLVPLCALFLVTPLFLKSAALCVGMFLWVTCWGILDAMSAQSASDAARSAFEEISRWGLSYDAIMSTPEAAVQALGIFSKARTHALMLSTAVCGSLFALTGYAWSGIATSWQNHLDQAGESAGRQSTLPEERGTLQHAVNISSASQAATAAAGFGSATFAHAGGSVSEAYGASSYISNRLFGGSPSGALASEGVVSAQTRLGNVAGMGRVAEETGRSLDSAAYELATFDRAMAGVSNLTERDVLRHGFGTETDAAVMRGGSRAGDTTALAEGYANVNRTDERSAAGFQQLGRQERGSLLGTSARVTTQQYIDSVGTNAEIDVARARTIDEMNGAELAGRMQGTEQVGSARGTDRALNSMGLTAYERGVEWSSLQRGAAGEAASEAGDMLGLSRQLGRTSIANEIASSNVSTMVAELLHLDPTRMDELILSNEVRQSSHVPLALSGERAMLVLNDLKEWGAIDQRMADYFRAKGGYRLDLTFDPETREPTMASISAGSRGEVLNHLRIADGTSKSFEDVRDTRVGATYQGGLGVLEAEYLETKLLETYGGNVAQGEYRDADYFAVAEGLGGAMASRGIKLEANANEQDGYNVSVAGQGNVGMRGLGGTLGLGAGLSGGWSRSDIDGRSTSVNLNTVLSAGMIEQARLDAISSYEAANGPGTATTADQSELAAAWALNVQEQFDGLIGRANDELASAKASHDVIQDAEDPDFKGSDLEYALKNQPPPMF